MQTQMVNEDAFMKAATFLVGPQATTDIIGLYQLIDTAQKEAHAQGVLQGQENVEAACDEAWDKGYDQGYDQGYDEAWAEADDAFVEGVRVARVSPALADELVGDIVAAQDQNAINGEFYEGGSDAEDDYCDICGGSCAANDPV